MGTGGGAEEWNRLSVSLQHAARTIFIKTQWHKQRAHTLANRPDRGGDS